MPVYTYRGTNRAGASVSGEMTAASKADLQNLLKRQQIAASKMSETGGILDTILQRLSSYIEKNVKLQRAVKSAMVYPIGVLTVAGGVITLLLWKVVPIFATLFAGLGVELPLPTRIVIALSNFIGSVFGLLALLGIVGSIFALKAWYGTPQ